MPYKLKLWHAWMCAALGGWLLVSSWGVDPGKRALFVSDQICGTLILIASVWSRGKKSIWLQWVLAAIGFWLLSAPLLFWAPRAFTYISDSLVGIGLMTFAVILPYATSTGGPVKPDDWSYNPSTWKQRWPVVIIGFVAYIAATYLAFFQLGYIKDVWDPFFNDGTRRVLTSDVSRAFPVSDAGLGALAYLLECVSGLVGDTRRWRTMPWMALLFWMLVVPAGVVSIVLVMLQPIAVGAWCFLCLTTATLTLVTIPPAMDEMVLTTQYLWKARQQGKDVWHIFWKGHIYAGTFHQQPEDTWDLSLPWTLCVSVVLGLWLMAAPGTLGFEGTLANSHFMTGALVITFAVIGMSEVGRPFRLLNLLLGGWAIAAPWVLSGGSMVIRATDLAAGFFIMGLALPLGRLTDRHGSWDKLTQWTPFPDVSKE